jgi:riboflavin synthase
MFTGLIETVGTVTNVSGDNPRRLTISASYDTAEVDIGASIAIDGCCLTVIEKHGNELTYEAATETLKLTTLGGLEKGAKVNLERSMRVGDRLGGHIVLGHVDGVGTVRSREQNGGSWYLGIEAPADLAPLIATRGSVVVSGVSLTVTDVKDRTFYIGLIPHTWEVTNLASYSVGSRINLEADVVARYVQRLLDWRR